jgi:Fic family protein
MTLVVKKIKGKSYYYSFLSYFLVDRAKSFSKYIGVKKPAEKKLKTVEDRFKDELVLRLSGKNYSSTFVSKDEVIKSLLFSLAFDKKYNKLTMLQRRKYDIDSTVRFTLTTLTTEEVNVDLIDVKNALDKISGLTYREQISKNMLRAVESIKEPNKLNSSYLLELHRTIMANFETKKPGEFRKKQVYLYRKGSFDDIELKYRPPEYRRVAKLLDEFFAWYGGSNINPVEKAAMAHYKLYKIHPFLDGNKRICRLIFNKTMMDDHFPLINISVNKEAYFDSLIMSVETNNPKQLVEFMFKQYYLQVKEFLSKKH